MTGETNHQRRLPMRRDPVPDRAAARRMPASATAACARRPLAIGARHLSRCPKQRLTWTRGTPGEFRSSAIVARGFCRDCGTPLYMKEDGDPNYEIAIGTLDNPELAPPSDQVGIESELSWFKPLSSLPRQSTEDDRSPEDLKKLRRLQHPDRDTETWPT